jgi:hypothetical protein
VTELEILDERGGFGEGLDGVGLEDHVREGLPSEQGSGDDLGENVEVDLHVVVISQRTHNRLIKVDLRPVPSSHK